MTVPSVRYPRIGLLIDDEWIHDRPACCEVRNPSDDSTLGPVPTATSQDLERALAAAARGFRIWRDTPPRDRVMLAAGWDERALHDAIAVTARAAFMQRLIGGFGLTPLTREAASRHARKRVERGYVNVVAQFREGKSEDPPSS